MVPHYLLLANKVVFYFLLFDYRMFVCYTFDDRGVIMREYLDSSLILQLKNLKDLARANMLVLIVFKNHLDLAGEIYIRHLNKVAEAFKDDNERIVALLHDLIEDTAFTFEDLLELGFSLNVVNTLKLLTNDLNDYELYIKRIISSDNLLAKRVKLADLLDNMNINRFAKLREEHFKRIRNKYLIAYEKILDDLERRTIND